MNLNKFTILLDKAYKIRRLPMKDWVRLEELRRQIENRAEDKEWAKVPKLIFDSIEICGGKNWKEPWYTTAEKYVLCLNANQPRVKFPLLTTKEKAKKMPWEYDGRTWYFWVNLFAEHYGWGEDEIGKLDLDDAIGLYQEILVNEQLEQEFTWGLSETSWEYVKSSGKSRLRPLPRPDWMAKYTEDQIKKRKDPVVRIPKSAMPSGLVLDVGQTNPA